MPETSTLSAASARRASTVTPRMGGRFWGDLRPILSTLRRHRIAAGLIVLEVALTCAIVTNALHLIQTRVEALNADSGMAEAELVVLNLRGSKATPRERVAAVVAEDIAQLRAIPGVKAATPANQIVYADNSNNSGVNLQPDNKGTRLIASQYTADDQMIPTFGLKLLEGRNFTPDEVLDSFKVFSVPEPRIGQIIINKVMAEKLFPGRSALGQTLYVFGNSPTTVIGVVETLTHPQMHRARSEGGASMIFPLMGGYNY
ncbi:ABC transporter permease, partial [Roseateles sp.]|uniref:ABC transporter permease n=1 Tax=Roseateles sp. TaxID=1971397 RepID=UPI0032655F49